MGRWEPNAPGRLEKAAWELFRDRGFDATSVADIANRAGLTERTFFRYYADKREVFFARSGQLQDRLIVALAETDPALGPLDAVGRALAVASQPLDENREFSRLRQAAIAGQPELQERELIKLASMAAAVAQALHARGVVEPAASLVAEAGISVFRLAIERWNRADDGRELAWHIDEAIAVLRVATSR